MLFLLWKKVSIDIQIDCLLSYLPHPTRDSVLPALSLKEGVLHCDILEGSFDTTSFYRFIKHTLDLMQPFPGPNSVIVIDNCKIHNHPDIQNLIDSQSVSHCFSFITDSMLMLSSGM